MIVVALRVLVALFGAFAASFFAVHGDVAWTLLALALVAFAVLYASLCNTLRTLRREEMK